jgi:hypothetical protein
MKWQIRPRSQDRTDLTVEIPDDHSNSDLIEIRFSAPANQRRISSANEDAGNARLVLISDFIVADASVGSARINLTVPESATLLLGEPAVPEKLGRRTIEACCDRLRSSEPLIMTAVAAVKS